MDETERTTRGEQDPKEEPTNTAPDGDAKMLRASDGAGEAPPGAGDEETPQASASRSPTTTNGPSDSAWGIVYVLTNERMPDLVKIGIVERGDAEFHLNARVKELSGVSGVPLPFEVHYAVRARDPRRLEGKLFRLFGEERVNPRREFFEVDPEKVVTAIGIGDFEELVTQAATGAEDPVEQAALDRAKARRSPINMLAIGLKPGDVLTFSRDESITATVADGSWVEFEGQTMALSPAANTVLERMGRRGGVSGSQFWAFEGETLEARRHRWEREAFDASPETGSF